MSQRDRENLSFISLMNYYEQNKDLLDSNLKMMLNQLDYDLEEDFDFEFDLYERFSKEELSQMNDSRLKQIQRRFRMDLSKLKKINFDLSQLVIMMEPKYKNN